MLRDDLNEPLTGLPAPAERPARRRAAAWVLPLAAAAGAAALAAVYVMRPAAAPVAAVIPFDAIATVAPPPPPAPMPSASAVGGLPNVADAGGIAVMRNGEKDAPARPMPKIIDVAEALANRLAPAPDRRLVEPSKYGALPRVGADGARPGEVYARTFAPSPAMRAAPRIALFVGGVGLDPETTRAAISRLPGAVSLGVAPYGAELAQVAQSARGEGHEIWLQAPMESVVGADPGPHTLKVGVSEADNADSLHWAMARFPGYVGIAGYLGAKFTADEAAFSPVLSEIGRRGLYYFDDGASPLSKAGDLAGGLDVKASRAEVIVDGGPPDAAFARAEDLARRRGSAIVVATALPATLEALARWTQGLEARGFVLAPLSLLTAAKRDRAASAAP